jgi:catechol 2,3-dioxygenase-like lactoylglutathione lyase family enzyme
MSIRRAIPVVVTADPQGTRAFYEDFLGFRVGMEQAGFLMFVSPSEPTTQVIVSWETEGGLMMDPSVPLVDISMEVENVDAAHADALARGLEIVYPLTDEPWGIRRFFVREPSGTVVNVGTHITDLRAAP